MNNLTKSDFDFAMQAAIEASRENNSEAAITLFIKASHIAPNMAAPYLLLAAEYMELTQYELAEMAFGRALLTNPQLHIARLQLGLLFFSTDRLELAIATWAPLTILEETNYFFHFAQGLIALTQNNQDLAIEQLNLGLLKNTENAPLNSDMANLVNKLRGEASLIDRDEMNTETSNALETTAAEKDEPQNNTEHFLLNQYQQGTLH